MTKEEPSLRDEIKKLNENFSEVVKKKEAKSFFFPFKARLSKKKVSDGYASVCYINENRGVNFMRVPIKEGAIMINGVPHIATTEYMLNYKNKPLLIVPSWNVEPFSPSKNLNEAEKENKLNLGYKLILNTLKSEQIQQKKTISGMTIFIIIIVIIIGLYAASKGGYLG